MFCDSVEVAQRITTFAPDTLQHIILFPNSSTNAKSASVSSVNSLVKIYDYEEFLVSFIFIYILNMLVTFVNSTRLLKDRMKLILQ